MQPNYSKKWLSKINEKSPTEPAEIMKPLNYDNQNTNQIYRQRYMVTSSVIQSERFVTFVTRQLDALEF